MLINVCSKKTVVFVFGLRTETHSPSMKVLYLEKKQRYSVI